MFPHGLDGPALCPLLCEHTSLLPLPPLLQLARGNTKVRIIFSSSHSVLKIKEPLHASLYSPLTSTLVALLLEVSAVEITRLATFEKIGRRIETWEKNMRQSFKKYNTLFDKYLTLSAVGMACVAYWWAAPPLSTWSHLHPLMLQVSLL